MRGRVTLWLAFVIAITVGGATWAQQVPPAQPSPRIKGFIAALEDRTDTVVVVALEELLKEEASGPVNPIDQILAAHSVRLKSLLESPNRQTRKVAAEAFARIGPTAAQNAQHLLPLLEDEDDDVREAAARVFAAMGLAAAPHAKRLAALIKEENDMVREAATKALVAMGPTAAEHLLPLLQDERPVLRREAVLAFIEMGPAATPHAKHLLPLLKDETPWIRSVSAKIFPAMGSAASDHLQEFLLLLKDKDSFIRRNAVKALIPFGASAIPHLLPLLKDSSSLVREAVAEAFGAMGPAAASQAPHLLPLLRDKDTDVSEAATKALAAIGPVASQQLLPLLKDKNKDVRATAVSVFAAMGPAAAPQAQHLLPLLKDRDEEVRLAAARAFAAMGPAAAPHAAHLLPLLRRDLSVTFGVIKQSADAREAAVSALAALGPDAIQHLLPLIKAPDAGDRMVVAEAYSAIGPKTAPHASHLLPLLQDQDGNVRAAAAEALAVMGAAGAPHAEHLLPLLQGGDWASRAAAAEAFAAMGPAAAPHAPYLLPLLNDTEKDVRDSAIKAFTAMGPAAAPHARHLLPLLTSSEKELRAAVVQAFAAMDPSISLYAQHFLQLLGDEDWAVRRGAVRSFAAMGPAAVPYAQQLLPLIKDEKELVRSAVAEAFAAMGPAAAPHFQHLLPLFKDKRASVQVAAAKAFVVMGPAATPHIQAFIRLLVDEDEDVHRAAVESLASMAPVPLEVHAALLARAHDEPSSHPKWLAYAYVAGGGAREVGLSLRWLAKTSDERPSHLEVDEARVTLQAFARLWPLTERSRRLRDDLAAQSATVAHLVRGQWSGPEDAALLLSVEKHLRDSHPKDAETLKSVVPTEKNPLRQYSWSLVAHPIFWVLMLFFYPRSSQVQAFFFWNPWMRKIFGFPYVGVALTWFPYLRNRLLMPFQSILTADAYRGRSPAETYFEGSEVIDASGTRKRLTQVLPELQGHVVLEGASGLGKSTFIRHLLSRSTRPAVYLTAAMCHQGVEKAIETKLHGYAADPVFLKSIIYSGAFDIYIDGLNEVTADTRAQIVEFVRRNHRGNILLATQRLEWEPPATARLYRLLPLGDEQIEEFLVKSEPTTEKNAKVRGEAYQVLCKQFVQAALASKQPKELVDATREVLSNPMDLTVVAQMLARGEQPDLFNLRRQQYELMAKDYKEVQGSDFPLKDFSEAAYQLRITDKVAIAQERFGKELLRLEYFKMVVHHQWKSPDKTDQSEWRFRHDKVQEFFIAQTFLGDDNPRPGDLAHIRDPRLRGVYFLLALILEEEKASELRELLIYYAAETGDHTMSDGFVNLLKARQNAERVKNKR